MERKRKDNLVYYQFKELALMDGVTHGVFTRRGGVSSSPFDSLNVGSTVGDDLHNVVTNRKRIANVMGTTADATRTTWQVHGAEVHVVRKNDPRQDPPPKADAVVTNDLDLPLEMRFADCVPIMLYDPVKRVIGLAHAGWRGTLAGVGPATVRTMVREFGSDPADIIAGIGPSIGPCCYEVGPEVVLQVRETFVHSDKLIKPPKNGGGEHFDLWHSNELALANVGVEHIEVAGLCTSCHTHEFFSHRAEAGRTGRFGAMLLMPNGASHNSNGKA